MRFERNIVLLFTTRIVRLFAYGFLSIVLVLYLFEIGLDNVHVGILLTCTLLGDALTLNHSPCQGQFLFRG